jgi:hypothetical protein
MRHPIQPGTTGHILSPFEDVRNPIAIGRPPQLGLRDPALFIRNGTVHLFYTACAWDGQEIISWIEQRSSLDLQHWSEPRRISPVPGLCSPGNVVEADGRFVLCCQHLPVTLPRFGVGYTRHDCRLWLLESDDLRDWSDPIAVAPGGSRAAWCDSPRMIDAYLVRDREAWLMFYKGHARIGANEHGGLIGLLSSRDLRTWEELSPDRPVFGDPDDASGQGYENPCVVRQGDGWRCYLKVCDGTSDLAVADSADLRRWSRPRPLDLPRRPWMSLPPNAPMVVDARACFGVWLMAFHCDQPALPLGGQIGLAWSVDGERWELS